MKTKDKIIKFIQEMSISLFMLLMLTLVPGRKPKKAKHSKKQKEN